MDASVFWDGIRAVRDLWHHDKPGLAWGIGVGLLLLWGTFWLVGAPVWVQPVVSGIGILGAVLFSVGLVVWIAFIPRRQHEFRRPNQ